MTVSVSLLGFVRVSHMRPEGARGRMGMLMRRLCRPCPTKMKV